MSIRIAFALLSLWSGVLCAQSSSVAVGSKYSPENTLLAEIAAQWLEANAIEVERRLGFGGTQLAFEALRNREIDFYPEYTGTINESILKNADDTNGLNERLAALDLRFESPLGFNNTYVLATRSELAGAISRVSDLRDHPNLRLAMSHEFMQRNDGWEGLKRRYALPHNPRGIEHGLAYQAIANDEIDVTDAYSTDGDIERYGLNLLTDDRDYFPRYDAGWLMSSDVDQRISDLLGRLAGRIDADKMRALNAEVVVNQRGFAEVAAAFLNTEFGVAQTTDRASWLVPLATQLKRHIELTLIAITLATLGGVLLALWSFPRPRVAATLLYIAGLLQTIPSIALLALMIPLLGIGFVPALVALVGYALLPILRATLTALGAVEPLHRRVAAAMGMTPREEFRHVLLPLALPHVIAGVRTASVICIGTATLAAFIGAGGLGEPIVTGLALNDTGMILRGAIPAALLAILTDLAFDLLERRFVAPHLRVSRSAGRAATPRAAD